MALYVKIEVGNELIAAYGVQRQTALKDKSEKYMYAANRYTKQDDGSFKKSTLAKDMRLVEHYGFELVDVEDVKEDNNGGYVNCPTCKERIDIE